MLPNWAYRLLLFTAFQLHLSFALLIDRFNTFAVIASFVGLWLVFLIQWTDQKMSVKKMIAVGMLLRCVYLLVFPELSDDFWRYLWDGMLIAEGASPYELLPANWAENGLSTSFGELLPMLNSPAYYSIYPPVLQFFFGLSAAISEGNPLLFVIVLRCFVLAAELGSMVLIWKLLKAWKMNTRNLMLYALNPLVIIEFSGSLHGEVFMILFLLLSLWFLTPPSASGGHLPFSGEERYSDQSLDQCASSPPAKGEYRVAGRGSNPAKEEGLKYSETKKAEAERLPRNSENEFLAMTGFRGEFLSAIAFGLSVGTKLLPLMFLPFCIKRLGWVKTFVYGIVTMVTVGLLYFPFRTVDMIPNTLSSVRLYFANFEFNASVYCVFREVGIILTGYNQIAIIGRMLSLIVLACILLIAWRNKNNQVSGLPTAMLFAWLIYYAFSTTVNPWYVAVLAAFLPFTKYRFALLWLMLVPLSYHAFGYADYHENLWVIALEYVPVYLLMLFELNVFALLEKKWALKRAEVKKKRLFPFLNKGEAVLEVGAGNGALSVLLGNEGVMIQPLDIVDKSLFKEVNVRVYDGEKFPFSDKQFDACQLITMLHHTTNAEELIREAKRISNHIIVMEDIYESPFQKYITWFTDSVVNWEFYGHPHTNRTDLEWKQLFERNVLKLEKVEYYRFLFFFKQVTYVLSQAETRVNEDLDPTELNGIVIP
ncbi:MAG: SAM-dependent methyltransferase [Bacteroidia bacterium]|jgi:alpha-1,6-mannosyltransferase